MLLFAVDVDDEEAKANHIPSEQRRGWWEAERTKLWALLLVHPGAFVFRTRHGYRIVYLLPTPLPLRKLSDGVAWRTWYRRCLCYLIRAFGIEGDVSVSQWNSYFRLPHATRGNASAPENLEIIGDARSVGAWTYELSLDDVEGDLVVARGLAARGGAHSDKWAAFARELGGPATAEPDDAGDRRVSRPRPCGASSVGVEEAVPEVVEALAPLLAGFSDGRRSVYLAIAGALCWHGIGASSVAATCEAIARQAGNDDKIEKRRADAQDTARAFLSDKRVTALGHLLGSPLTLAIGEALREALWKREHIAARGVKRLRDMMTTPTPSSPPTAMRAFEDVVAEYVKNFDRSKLTVLAPPFGIDTAGLARKIAQKDERRRPFAIVHPRLQHAQVAFTALGHGRHATLHRGVLSVKNENGEPVCKYSARAQRVQNAGGSVPHLMCARCPEVDCVAPLCQRA
jgi:hypothetical protein